MALARVFRRHPGCRGCYLLTKRRSRDRVKHDTISVQQNLPRLPQNIISPQLTPHLAPKSQRPRTSIILPARRANPSTTMGVVQHHRGIHILNRLRLTITNANDTSIWSGPIWGWRCHRCRLARQANRFRRRCCRCRCRRRRHHRRRNR